MYLMRGGRINQGQGLGGMREDIIIPEEILYRSVKLVRGIIRDCRNIIANVSTGHPMGGFAVAYNLVYTFFRQLPLQLTCLWGCFDGLRLGCI